MRAARRAAALAAGLLLSVACSHDSPLLDEPTDPAGTVLPPVAVTVTPGGASPLAIPTYDSSGQVTEPDVVHRPDGWHGWEYWMAMNPYPNSNDLFENASIVVSHDGLSWSEPAGIRNPVVPKPNTFIHHNSDPDLVYLSQLDRLVLFYRGVTDAHNLLLAVTSSDGVHWSKPVEVLSGPNHTVISPSVVLAPNRRPKLYYVDAGRFGCAAGSTRVMMRRWMTSLHDDDALVGAEGWSDTVATNLNGPPGWNIWHVDVTWVNERGEYWAVFPAYPPPAICSQSDLFMARSRDAVHWQVLPDPVLRRGDLPWTARSLYRASLEYDAPGHQFRVWFSGQDMNGAWRIGHQTFPIQDLLGQLR